MPHVTPDLCSARFIMHCDRRLVESVGGVFGLVVSSALVVFEHVKDELSVIPCLLRARTPTRSPSDLVTCTLGSRPL